MALSLYHLADLYYQQGKYEQAIPLFQRALAIREQVLGLVHPDTIKVRERYTELLNTMHGSEKATHQQDIMPPR